MRCMLVVKADKHSEAGVLPDEKLLTEIGKSNEELAKARMLLAAKELQPRLNGARRVLWSQAHHDQRAFLVR
jgi:hypothetical protein